MSNPLKSEIYLVARIERVLLGGISKSAHPYTKKDESQKVIDGILKSVRSACDRIPEHRMPFAWGALPIISDDGKLITCGTDQHFSYTDFYRQDEKRLSDEDLLKFLAEIKRPGRLLDKLETIYRPPNGSILSIKIHQAQENLVDVLTSSLHPVVPYHAAGGDPYFENDSFELLRPEMLRRAKPYNSYLNHLYVRPLSIRYGNQKTFPKARNLAIQVELWDGDEIGKSKKLCCIYTRPETRGLIFDTARHTAVTHHSTDPQFYEEIKIELPPHIHDGHNIRFTVFHVAVEAKGKSKKDERTTTEVGSSWFRLKHTDGRLFNGIYDIPVYVTGPQGEKERTIPNRYLQVRQGEGAWVENGNPLLRFELVLKSTINIPHQQDQAIKSGNLLHAFVMKNDKYNNIQALLGENPSVLIQHLPLGMFSTLMLGREFQLFNRT